MKMLKIRGMFVSLATVIMVAGMFVVSYSQWGKVENFVVYDVNGNRNVFYDMFASLPANGVMILNFTSVNCKPCKKEIPELLTIAAKSGNKARLVCIYAESGKPVKDSAYNLGVQKNAYVDTFGNIRKQFDVKKIPVTLVISKDYRILGRFECYSEENIRKIEKLVPQK